jgi:hypothetical protein
MSKLRKFVKGISAGLAVVSLSLLCVLGIPNGTNIFTSNMLFLWTSGVVSGAVCFFIENSNHINNIKWGN